MISTINWDAMLQGKRFSDAAALFQWAVTIDKTMSPAIKQLGLCDCDSSQNTRSL